MSEQQQLPLRENIDSKYIWNLEDIYESVKEWEKDFNVVESRISGYETFVGHLGNSAETLLKALDFDSEIGKVLEKLQLYAMLLKDTDLSNPQGVSMEDRLTELYTQVSRASAFINPEILDIDESKLNGWIESAEFADYKHGLRDLLRRRVHFLPKEQEELLALTMPVLEVPHNAYSLFTDADLDFGTIVDDKGAEVQVTHGRYYAAMHSSDRNYRKRYYEQYFKPFRQFRATLNQLYGGVVKSHILSARARKYDSTLHAALDRNDVPVSVYHKLIESIGANLEPMHRWIKLRKQVLGISDFHTYDTLAALFPAVSRSYSYEEACEIVLKALKSMGETYLSDLKRAFDNRWIDVFETKNKRSGAYSSGTTWEVHPYVLLNWNNQLEDVFTLAHEMGHNMHSWYTGKHQAYPNAHYSIFLAEIASTANEALLMDYLIKQAETREEKLALIEKSITNLIGTVYRQTAFAEFEYETHRRMEHGEALSPDALDELYAEITQRQWGSELVMDEATPSTWGRIPHFYYNYYVYQYATGFAASQLISERILREGAAYAQRYIDGFLCAGASKPPIRILQSIEVDMISDEPVLAVTRRFNKLLDDMEVLIREET